MRYRPFTQAGHSASAITLVLDDEPMRPAARAKLITAALEAGVNSYEIAASGPAVAEAIGEAAAVVGRSMLVLSLRLGRHGPGGRVDFSASGLSAGLEASLSRSRIGHFDAVVVDDPDEGELSSEAWAVLDAARAERLARLVGLAGARAATDVHLRARSFDLLATPFNLKSGWPERNRIKSAVQAGMTVVGYDFDLKFASAAQAQVQASARAKPWAGLFRRPEAAVAAHAYDFLRDTRGWTSEEICLAFALTEPSLASVRVHAHATEQLERLAAASEREFPAGVAAQIEMARFAAAA